MLPDTLMPVLLEQSRLKTDLKPEIWIWMFWFTRIIWVHYCWLKRCLHSSPREVNIMLPRPSDFVRNFTSVELSWRKLRQVRNWVISLPRDYPNYFWIPPSQDCWGDCFVLVTIACALSCKLERECRDRSRSVSSRDKSRSVSETYRPLALARLYSESRIFTVNLGYGTVKVLYV